MRDIKFRSWSEKYRKFYYFYKGLVFDCESKIEKITHIGGNNFYKFNWDNAEQFTELKDKNGNDVYEGDILEYYCSTFNRAELQKVIFGWYYTDNDGRCHENVMGWVDEDGFPIDTKENEYTIIGNIHQQKQPC